jgi:hypothetical protein
MLTAGRSTRDVVTDKEGLWRMFRLLFEHCSILPPQLKPYNMTLHRKEASKDINRVAKG